MRKTIVALSVLSLLLLAGGCAPEGEPQVAPESEESPLVQLAPAVEPALPAVVQPTAPQVPMPENVEVEGGWLFAMETTPELLQLTLHGTDQERLAGKLADDEGRREIVHYGNGQRAPQVIFAKDWLLPAVGAVNRAGEAFVCVNRLVGEPSQLTKGNMPDPANGIDLVCRWRTGRGWSREFRVDRTAAALWLTDVVAAPDGSFRIIYSQDSSGLLVDDAQQGEGLYRLVFERGRMGRPELVSRFERPE